MLPDEFCKTRLNNAQFVTVHVCLLLCRSTYDRLLILAVYHE